jgi:hypothetical protein
MLKAVSFLTIFFFICLSLFSTKSNAGEADTAKKKTAVTKKSKKKKTGVKKLTIIGIVEKTKEDEEGNVTGLVIKVKKRRRPRLYHVNMEKGTGKELIKLIGKKVKVTGIVKKDPKRKRTIIVKKHSLVKKSKKTKSKTVNKSKSQ